MNTRIRLLFRVVMFVCMFPSHIAAQESVILPAPTPNEVLEWSSHDLLHAFYQRLFENRKYDYYGEFGIFGIRPDEWEKIMQNRSALTQGYQLDVIEKIINESPSYDDGFEMDSLFSLTFPNGKTIYVDISDGSFNHIWLPDGLDVYYSHDESCNPAVHYYYFKRPAIICDSDGYTNIRERPDRDSKIVGRLLRNQLFFFTPASDTEWYQVYTDELSPSIGYIHKSRITLYNDFPDTIKEQVHKTRNGC